MTIHADAIACVLCVHLYSLLVSPALFSPALRCGVLLPHCSDKRVVREPDTEKDVWWGAGSPNYEMDEK